MEMRNIEVYHSFFAELLGQIARGKSVRIIASGWSMLPLLWHQRDSLELSPLQPDSLSLGRILLFRMPENNRYSIHRLVKIEGDMLTFRGDGNPYQIEQCHRENVLAEVRMVVRDGTEVRMGDPLWERIERYWPKNSFLRRIAVGLYRRLYLRGLYIPPGKRRGR